MYELQPEDVTLEIPFMEIDRVEEGVLPLRVLVSFDALKSTGVAEAQKTILRLIKQVEGKLKGRVRIRSLVSAFGKDSIFLAARGDGGVCPFTVMAPFEMRICVSHGKSS